MRNARSSIAKHDELRKVLVACAELEEELESKGTSEDEITRAVMALRTNLTNEKEESMMIGKTKFTAITQDFRPSSIRLRSMS